MTCNALSYISVSIILFVCRHFSLQMFSKTLIIQHHLEKCRATICVGIYRENRQENGSGNAQLNTIHAGCLNQGRQITN